MKYSKLIATLFMSGVVGFTLTSCGGGDTSKTITFYTSAGDSLVAYMNDAIAEFESENPGWEVEIVNPGGGYDGIKSRIIADLQASSQPSVAYCYADHVAEYLPTGKVLDLYQFINDSTVGYSAEEVADFVPGYWEEGTEFGDSSKMYTVPFQKSTEVMYYNKDVLDELGIDYSNIDNWTWDDLWAACRTIKNNANYKDWTPMGYDSEANWFITLDEQYGYDYTSATGEHYLFNNTDNINMLKDLKAKFDEGLFTTQTIEGGYTSNLFVADRIDEGKKDDPTDDKPMKPTEYRSCVFSIGSTGGASHQDPLGQFEYGVAPLPQVDPENRKSISQGPSLVLFDQGSEEKAKMTWLFVKKLLDPTFQGRFAMGSGYMPVRQSTLTNGDFAAWLAAGEDITAVTMKVASEYVDSYFVSPAFDGSNKAREQVQAALVNAVTAANGMTVEQALQDAYDECIF